MNKKRRDVARYIPTPPVQKRPDPKIEVITIVPIFGTLYYLFYTKFALDNSIVIILFRTNSDIFMFY
jgi:hypothetical protein